jgi:hypothetical protein
VFTLDENECNDLDYLFEEDCKDTQCKRLIGKNIDFKMDFDSKLHCATSDSSIVALIFGSQSVLLELDESNYPKITKNEEDEAEFLYQKSIANLNDLAYVFKQILFHQYSTDGYIRITEDQGDWDMPESFMPVTLHMADFVTLI